MSKYIYNEEDLKLSIHGRSFMQVVEEVVTDREFSTVHFLMQETLTGYIVSIYRSTEHKVSGQYFTKYYNTPRLTQQGMEALFKTGLVRWIEGGNTGKLYDTEYPTLVIAFKREV
jgi:hypothetical protein